MFTVYRDWLKYGNEYDDVETTIKWYDTEDKAIAYAERYARGIRFVSAQVYDENDNVIYEICEYGAATYDYRQKGETK